MTRLSWAFVASLCVSTGIHAAVIPLPNGYHQYFGRNNNLEWKNCSLDGLPGRECTRFEVPLDWHDHAAGKGSLFVARYPAIKQPKMGTLFVNPGGPGGSGAEYVQGATADYLMEQSGGAYDIVGWDPRGVGQTIPRVACFDTAEEEVAFWNGTIVENGLDVRGNFTSKADLDAFYDQVNEADDYLQRFAQQCMSHRPGIYRYVGTAATVRDMVAMHDVLEGSDKPIDYWGVSYGTVIGMYFVNMFPDRVGRVVLDGVVDPKDWANRPAHKWLGNALISTDETFDGFAEECIRAGPSACALAEQNATVASIRQLTRDLIDAAYDYRQEVGPSSMLNSFVVRGG
ncbi:Putative hydrolase Mb2248c [Rhizoctonia solani AG-1 IB]|uniref:Putative hydrolase Mb2248c n=1 Tax=Thanatephorus cucumeris (strain AG1-IB / isolate 7/3/14) TaxID=1108050 RepID=M5C612_THACB|nr:Putative hydrolase Mb2248c [Rhizoctonia solani AG-1 IB]